MTINEYQKLAMTTLNPQLSKKDILINSVMGLCGESGEAIDLVKKHLAQGHELDREALIKELGDIAWYLAEAATVLDIELEEVLQRNIDKLKKRYPQGFAVDKSVNREEKKDLNRMEQYSVCLPSVLGGMDAEEALKIVKETGYQRYEFWGWWDQDIDAYVDAQKKEGLQITTMCTKNIPLNDPSYREAFIEGLKETAEVCQKLGCKTIITQTGQELSDVSREEQHQSIVEGLRACKSVLEEYDLTLLLEPLNTRVDHVGYYLWSSEEAFQMIDEVNNVHVKVLYDLYHQYVMDDLNLERIVENIEKIGHFHMAGYPGRHETTQDSEIDYDKILRAIWKSGYEGTVGIEYFPVHAAKEGLLKLYNQLALI